MNDISFFEVTDVIHVLAFTNGRFITQTYSSNSQKVKKWFDYQTFFIKLNVFFGVEFQSKSRLNIDKNE